MDLMNSNKLNSATRLFNIYVEGIESLLSGGLNSDFETPVRFSVGWTISERLIRSNSR